MIDIPEQILNCRFVKVLGRTKGAFEPGWQTTANYTHDDPELIAHLEAGNNYGVMPDGGVLQIDADTTELWNLIPADWKQSFTVKSGGEGDRYHLYVLCPGSPPEKFTLKKDGVDLGDIRGNNSPFYIVGPGSIHPDTGRKYEVVDPDAPVIPVPYSEVLATLIDPFRATKAINRERQQNSSIVPQKPRSWIGNTISDRLGLRCDDIGYPLEAVRGRTQIQGAHPFHGSTTGTNFTIDTSKNVWHCFRHNSGGGPLELFAISKGIISCEDAGPGCLDDHWSRVFTELRKDGYDLVAAGLEIPQSICNIKRLMRAAQARRRVTQ